MSECKKKPYCGNITTGFLNDVRSNGGLCWVLTESWHPNFNIWRACLWNGNYYFESFPKGVDPNLILIEKYGEQLLTNEGKEFVQL